MDVVLGVHEFEAQEQLIKKHQSCLETEFAAAKVVEVFETRPKQISCNENHLVFNRNSLFNQFWEANALQDLVVLNLL